MPGVAEASAETGDKQISEFKARLAELRQKRAQLLLTDTDESPEVAVKLGWAHGALVTTFPGYTSMATLEQVRSFAKGGSARIQR